MHNGCPQAVQQLLGLTWDDNNMLIHMCSAQAVFSRPVIALGSDFGQQALPASLVSKHKRLLAEQASNQTKYCTVNEHHAADLSKCMWCQHIGHCVASTR